MGWDGDEPGKDKNKWTGKGQPPDLDEALKRFQAKIKKTLQGGGKPDSSSSPGLPKPSGILALLLLGIVAVLWFLSGIFIVDPAEQAAIMRFGKYIRTVGSGPHWIPRFIESKIIVNVERNKDYSYSAQMLTKNEYLVSVSLAVQYRINDLEAYLFDVSDPEESLQQATSSALRQVVAANTFDGIVTEEQEAWTLQVQETLIKILDSYKAGIVIMAVSPQYARAPENVQDAYDDAIKAKGDKKRFKEQADAYKERVVPTAKGNAERILAEASAFAKEVVLKAKGDVAEFLALLPEYVRAPQVTFERMYLDMVEHVLSRTTKIVVNEKSGNILYMPLDKLLNPLSQKTDAQADAKPAIPLKAEPEEDTEINRDITRNLNRNLKRPEGNW